MNKPLKEKKCKECSNKFTPQRPLQYLCSIECSIKDARKKQAKKEKKADKVVKDKLMTKGEWLNLAQKVFNSWIRLRDKDNFCISCDTPMQGRKGDASHFYPTTYTYLRFNPDNVHLSCVTCNQFKHGNLQEYRPRLINKIGLKRVEYLDNCRHLKLEMDINDIKELIKLYKLKIKELQK